MKQYKTFSELEAEIEAYEKNKTWLQAVRDFVRWKIIGSYSRGGLVGLYYYLRDLLWKRFHIINISKADQVYDIGWVDRDHAILLACFKILTDFVEKEHPEVGLASVEDFHPYSDDELMIIERQIATEREIRALYEWWKKERPEVHKKIGFNWTEMDALSEKDDEMLLRLMKVRGALWT